MLSSLYKITGNITTFYPEREATLNDGEVLKIREFDIVSSCYDQFSLKEEKIEAHFTIKRKKAIRELDKIDIGDTVEIYFTIRGFHWKGKDGVDGRFDDWVYNNLLVKRIRKVEFTQSEFDDDIDEWRRQQREEMG